MEDYMMGLRSPSAAPSLRQRNRNHGDTPRYCHSPILFPESSNAWSGCRFNWRKCSTI